jgi:PAS domain S-box-containing protein
MDKKFEEKARRYLGDVPLPPALTAFLEDVEREGASLFENAHDPIIVLDLEGVITRVNKAVEAYGFTKSQLVGKKIFNFIPSEYQPQIANDMAQIMEEKSVGGVIEIITPNGRAFMEYRSSPIIAIGTVVGLQATLRDITEHRHMEEQLAKEKELIEEKVKDRTRELEYERTKLIEITEHMTMGVILLGNNGDVGFVNDATKRLLNLGDSKQAIDALVAMFPNQPVRQNISEALAGRPSEFKEAEAEGRIFTLSFATLERDREIFGALIWLLDITSQKMLERSRNQFIAIASHEMRTPLALIRGNAELMLEDGAIKSNDELKQQDKSIVKAAVRLLSIVNDFLDVENLEQGKVALKIETVDLTKTLTETLADLKPLADEKNLSLTFNSASAPELPLVQLDKYRLQQIYTNLVSNAIHYTEEGGITLTVERAGDAAKIFVADTGIGMEPEDQIRLFHKFETGRTFIRSKEFGSGMGLYISKILARLMGGDLELEKSEFGSGSTFCLTIPLVQKEEALSREGPGTIRIPTESL